MPTWGQLLQELLLLEANYVPPALSAGVPIVSPADTLRRTYLAKLSANTGRATILYYSAFQESPDAPPRTLAVGSNDMAGFMEACHDVPEKKLDLFLHSAGGDGEAAEQICAYLRSQFEHIRAVVPVYAMSAATMMALSADVILMGAHSQLGPIDPQMTISTPSGARSASAQAIKDQFQMALTQCQDPKNLAAWTPILRDYSPGLLAACDHAAERARKIVAGALEQYMFAGEPDPAGAAKATAEWFGNAEEFRSHGRPVRRDEARAHGVNVVDLEDDPELQDLVLSVHHATKITLARTGTLKLVENHRGRAWLNQVQTQLIAMPTGAGQPQTPKPPALAAQAASSRRGAKRSGKRN